jgi:cell division protein DivIC
MNSILTHIPAWIKNKFFIAFAVFCVVVFFLDKNDLFTQLERSKELKELVQSKEFYTKEIATERADLEGLKSDPAVMEKYAREKHLMKRDNEDLFLVPEISDTPKK